MKKKINSEKLYMLMLLKAEIMTKSDLELNSDIDFSVLADWINNKKKVSCGKICDKTLRNWWEDKDPKTNPTKSKLSLVVESIGYKNWDSFCDIKSRHTTLHSFFDPLELNVENMEVGKSYIIGWFPQHYTELKYLGNYKFEVLSLSPTNKLKVGEKKEIRGFGIAYMLHYSTIVHENGEEEVVVGYPLYPTITIRTSKVDNESIDNQKYDFIHING